MFCQHERVHDSQHRIDGIGIRRLADPAASSCCLPFGQKIAAAQRPAALLLGYRNLRIRIRESRWLEIDVELDLSVLGIAHESGVAVLQKGKKVGIAGPHAHRHAADFNGEAETFDFGDGLGQWTARISNCLHL